LNFYITLSSKNKKTGGIPVATGSRETCPISCPLKDNGCYADGGPLRIHWDKVTSGERGTDFGTFCKTIEMMPKEQLWRYGQAGDLPGVGDKISKPHMEKLVKANANRPVIAYTHKPPTVENIAILKDAVSKGFNVNLSADDLEEADELSDTGLPVVVVLPTEYGKTKKEGLDEYNSRITDLKFSTPAGRKIAVCPQTYLEDVTCGQCMACAKPDRNGVIIGFPAHGNRAKRIDERLQAGDLHHTKTVGGIGESNRPSL
jgi:hypothetical protein